MADRLAPSSYPLLQNFNPSMLQQQQNQQQSQSNQSNQPSQNQQQQVQQLQDLQQGQVGSMNIQDNARLWQQMQQQFPQFRNSAPGLDNNQQMVEFLRSRGFNPAQQQQQHQQQFTLGVNPLGGSGGPPHQPSFHDQSNGQPSQPPNMQPGFPNMGLGNSMANRNIAALQAFQASRQLDLMALAHNQQNQNGPINHVARMAHIQAMHQQREQAQQHHQQREQQQGPGAASADIFSSPAMGAPEGVRRSPSHASPQPPPGVAIPPNMPPNPEVSQPSAPLPARRMMTLAELRERANQVRILINAGEQAIAQLSANRAGLPEATFMTKMTGLQADLKGKREYFAKLNAAMQIQTQGLNPVQLASLSGMGPGQFQNLAAGQTTGWMNQAGGSPASFGNQQGPQHPNAAVGGMQGMQQSPAHLHAQANLMMANGVVPPRSGPTPLQQQREQLQREQQQRDHQQQHMGGQFGLNGQMSPPPVGQQFGFGVPGGGSNLVNPASAPSGAAPPNVTNAPNGSGIPHQQQHSGPMGITLPPPLQKNRFEEAYTNFCKSKGISHDPRLMSVDGRPIDLHTLHRQVLMEGGVGKVNQKDLWAVIGARMGFVNFQASDTEPAKCGPAAAGQLAHVYKEYLAQFDLVYITSVMEQKKKQMLSQTAGGGADAGAVGINMGQNGPRSAISPQQMQLMVQYASQSAAELRARGVNERLIAFVEQHRANLQRTATDQTLFRGQLRPGIQVGQDGLGGGLKSGQHQGGSAGAEAEAHGHPNGLPQPMPSHPFAGSAQANPAMVRPPLPVGPGGVPLGGLIPNGNSIGSMLMRSEPHLTNTAMKMITQLKSEIPNQLEQLHTATAMVTPDQRVEYNQLIEQVFRASQEFDSKLPMFFVLLRNDDMVKKLVAINHSIQTQRSLLSSNQPRFVIGLENLRSMSAELQKAKEIFQVALANFVKQQQAASNMVAGRSSGPPPGPPATGLPQPSQTTPPNMQPPQPPQSVPPQAANRPTVPLRPPPSAKPKQSIQPSLNPSATSAPTPPPTHTAAASTPVASASSPIQTAASPQAPKSPKTKMPPKPKAPAKARRPSKVGVSPSIAAADPPRPPSTSAGTKRPREEGPIPSGSNVASTPQPSGSAAGPSSSIANEGSPPKRMKTEWDAKDGPVMEEDADKQVIESIKTVEDASAFMEQMAELIKLAASNGEGHSSITSDISDTLDEILKGYGGGPEADLSIGALEANHLASTSELPPSTSTDEFEEFFNFASFSANDDDDTGSKAATPDLIPSSSANPSPESNAETDAAHPPLGLDVKLEDAPDPLRLGIWKEIDGGESSFYHTNEWKWDGPMPSLESWPLLS